MVKATGRGAPDVVSNRAAVALHHCDRVARQAAVGAVVVRAAEAATPGAPARQRAPCRATGMVPAPTAAHRALDRRARTPLRRTRPAAAQACVAGTPTARCQLTRHPCCFSLFASAQTHSSGCTHRPDVRCRQPVLQIKAHSEQLAHLLTAQSWHMVTGLVAACAAHAPWNTRRHSPVHAQATPSPSAATLCSHAAHTMLGAALRRACPAGLAAPGAGSAERLGWVPDPAALLAGAPVAADRLGGAKGSRAAVNAAMGARSGLGSGLPSAAAACDVTCILATSSSRMRGG